MVAINRAQRIGDEMRRELGRLLIHEVNDPRLKMVSVMDCQVSRDLSYAKVFFTLVNDNFTVEDVTTALNKASGFFRSRIAEIFDLRKTPRLGFVYDKSLNHAYHITHLIEEALTQDKAKAEAASHEVDPTQDKSKTDIA